MGGRSLSESDQAVVWDLWKAGMSMERIARVIGRSRGSVRVVLYREGGYQPARRQRAAHQLTLAEREEISRGVSAQRPARCIARQLGRAVSTVTREIQRNGGRGHYRASQAEHAAWQRGKRPKLCLLQQRPRLCQQVEWGLRQQWSPQQISQNLVQQFPSDDSMRVSHETIYRSLFVQSRGLLKKQLQQELRSRRRLRGARAAAKQDQRGQLIDAISIRERPAEVEDRAVPGHWEGDLIIGRSNSYIATLVERYSRYVMLVKVPNKQTEVVVKELSRMMLKLPAHLRRSLTWDRGKELAHHKDFTIATDAAVYFCDPHSPWQRGSNENTNGLLRQYFPKDTDLSVHSQAHLNMIAKRLNQRPRETLQWRTPAQKLSETVALTG